MSYTKLYIYQEKKAIQSCFKKLSFHLSYSNVHISIAINVAKLRPNSKFCDKEYIHEL